LACALGMHLDEGARAFAIRIGDTREALFHHARLVVLPSARALAWSSIVRMMRPLRSDGGCTMNDKPAKPVC
jgi:hypothetical protein